MRQRVREPRPSQPQPDLIYEARKAGLMIPDDNVDGPNCATTAVAVAAGVSFERAWEVLKDADERNWQDMRDPTVPIFTVREAKKSGHIGFYQEPYRPFSGGAVKKVTNRGLEVLGVNVRDLPPDVSFMKPVDKDGYYHQALTVKQFAKKYTLASQTRYLVFAGEVSSRHVQVVGGGIVTDQGGPRWFKDARHNACIEDVWEIAEENIPEAITYTAKEAAEAAAA